MKGDFSRKTFEVARHYSGVLMQQGRVQLDADWNEQIAIQRHHDVTGAEDVIGPCGAPKYAAGFGVQPAPDGADLLLLPGRYYVHGRLCELEATPVAASFVSATSITVEFWHVDGGGFAAGQYLELRANGLAPLVARVQTADETNLQLGFTASIAAFQSASGLQVRRLLTYLTQPDLPDPPYADAGDPKTLDLPDGHYLVYLDVWPRHLTALDDERIREKALGGPDTATRLKTVWQVRLWPGPDDGAALPPDTTCESDVAGWEAHTAAPTGRLGARAKPGQEPGPCVLPPGAGYLGLENQLYRVEIHEGGTLGADTVTFKWSRDNGSVVKAILPIPNTTDHTVEPGPDELLALANGQWVEQVDDATELLGVARALFQFQRDPVTGAVTLSFPVDETRHPQLRRWDSPGAVTIPWPPVAGGWIALENGVEVRFEAGTYRTGDFWLIPARTALGDVEWPRDAAGEPVAQPRRGVHHHYCRIGVLAVQGDTLAVEDCRPIFPPLSELKAPYSCCTFTVGDGSTHVGDFTLIQEAVDHLPAEGGQICIFPGTYTENVVVAGRKDVHIKGCGPRTRIVSGPAGEDGVAGPVFHLVATDGVKIESLAIEAAESAPGIFADGQKPSTRLTVEKVHLTAVKASGIRVRGAADVTIEHCRILMTDTNGGAPAIHLQAEGALVRENEVVGGLSGQPAEKVFALDGGLTVSGLQLAGGCERVRVHDNLLQGCSGQGITLGSVVKVDANGEPVDPDGPQDPGAGDPCDLCHDPSTGDDPGGGPGDGPSRFSSEGFLRDIDIRRNRIFESGLDGVGVARFFDLAQDAKLSASVVVQDLALVDNRIERSVRRKFAPIPAAMGDLMAYGGISLSFVEGLLLRDNRIEDVGHAGVLPVCGVFVLYVEGLEIGRNHVLNSGWAGPFELDGPAGRGGGIHVVHALPLQGTVNAAPDAAAFAARGRTLLRRSAPAAVIEENTVDVGRGQALSLGALGPVSVVANRLVSRGLAPFDPRTVFRAGAAPSALASLSSLVAIVNLGSSGGAVNLGAAVQADSVSTGTFWGFDLAREVLFDDNQCRLELLGERAKGAELPGQAHLPAILILGLDDLGFADNQCDCLIEEGQMPVAALLLGLVSVRAVANRFAETLGRAKFSALSFGILNMTVNNQANHCLRALGSVKQDQPNHVIMSLVQKEYCAGAERDLTALMAAFS